LLKNDNFSISIEKKGFVFDKAIEVFSWISESIISEKKRSGKINIVFCSDKRLHEINVDYLNHDTLTDVITFDYSEGKTISGDIFISVDRVEENHQSHQSSFINEVLRIIIHGVLHLCGYKDKTPEDKLLMTKKEDFYLSLFLLT